ncbi:MAG TPA: hypothetical protein VK615_07575 [Candidatus Binatia bacterium]|nr:hypothetical protein [Candidatus Binatia bacterium]
MQQVSHRLIDKTLARLGRVPADKIGLCLDRWEARQPNIIRYLLHAGDYLPERCASSLIHLFWIIAESTQGLAELSTVSDELIVRAHEANLLALGDIEPSHPEWETRMTEHFASFRQMPLLAFAFSVFDSEDACALDVDEMEPGVLAIKTVLDCLDLISHTPSRGVARLNRGKSDQKGT